MRALALAALPLLACSTGTTVGLGDAAGAGDGGVVDRGVMEDRDAGADAGFDAGQLCPRTCPSQTTCAANQEGCRCAAFCPNGSTALRFCSSGTWLASPDECRDFLDAGFPDAESILDSGPVDSGALPSCGSGTIAIDLAVVNEQQSDHVEGPAMVVIPPNLTGFIVAFEGGRSVIVGSSSFFPPSSGRVHASVEWGPGGAFTSECTVAFREVDSSGQPGALISIAWQLHGGAVLPVAREFQLEVQPASCGQEDGCSAQQGLNLFIRTASDSATVGPRQQGRLPAFTIQNGDSYARIGPRMCTDQTDNLAGAIYRR
ncbi:MAG: hypothetical protein U1E65_31235 [Myxococcota bacterium]